MEIALDVTGFENKDAHLRIMCYYRDVLVTAIRFNIIEFRACMYI